jgi:alginate O-acetyltransferase complex protein AlgI
VLSRSLGEFWSRRWNTAYVELNQVLFLPPLRRLLGRRRSLIAAFLLSGVFHELAISVPVQAGYGGPLAYFTLHAGLAAIEPRLRIVHWPAVAARLWTWLWVLTPLPLLFHTPFRGALVTPLFWS